MHFCISIFEQLSWCCPYCIGTVTKCINVTLAMVKATFFALLTVVWTCSFPVDDHWLKFFYIKHPTVLMIFFFKFWFYSSQHRVWLVCFYVVLFVFMSDFALIGTPFQPNAAVQFTFIFIQWFNFFYDHAGLLFEMLRSTRKDSKSTWKVSLSNGYLY